MKNKKNLTDKELVNYYKKRASFLGCILAILFATMDILSFFFGN